ncbi:MAG TPA: choice-of-anchor Q domain-containing protein, partial [Phycisphaerae bacterium]|nr:choice-of-anchor Q domain-containing protein [Phycisphaerae bacterium]
VRIADDRTTTGETLLDPARVGRASLRPRADRPNAAKRLSKLACFGTSGSAPVVTNCILWGDSAPEIIGGASVYYSDVEGGWTGTGSDNTDTDPLFDDPDNGDYHLTGDSPCIDAGDNNAVSVITDLDGKPRIVGDAVDMGAYEFGLVDIDVKPGSYPNAINLGSQGVVPVAILSSAEFDALDADPATVALSGAGVAVRGRGDRLMAHEQDVNDDGLVDLVVQVETENLDPDTFQDGYAILTGRTYGGLAFLGLDEITIVPPE